MEFEVSDNANCLSNSTFPNICLFRIFNGGFLALMSFCGVILNLLVMYLVTGAKINIGSSNQVIFMFNLAVSNLMTAIVGTLRGLGILSPIFIGVIGTDLRVTWFCNFYVLFMMFVSYSNCPCMALITLDRFVAVVFPFRHRTLFTKWRCVAMSVVVWFPQIIFYTWYVVKYLQGDAELFYYHNYHRCINNYNSMSWVRTARFVSLVWIPFGFIILMYIVIIYKVRATGLKFNRLLWICTGILLTGAIAWFPSIISSIYTINMDYKTSQILTVTLFYSNSLSDPVIYILGYPTVKLYLQNLWRKIRCLPPLEDDNTMKSSRFVRPTVILEPVKNNCTTFQNRVLKQHADSAL